MSGRSGLRLQKLREAVAPELARKIKSSRAWLNVQQMLKRSGKVCVTELFSGAEKAGPNHFSFSDVTHLYQLYAAVERFKAESEGTLALEICALPRVWQPWPYNFVIVPKGIRRKMAGFMLRDLYGRQAAVAGDSPGGIKGSLYTALRTSCGDRKKLDIALAELFPEDEKPVHPKTIHPGVNLNSQPAPVFTLLWLECDRLGFHQESERIRNLVKIIHDTQMLERLASAVFFSFVYCCDREDLFTAFFSLFQGKGRMKYNCTENENNYISEQFFHQQQKILEYVDDIDNRFLLNAYRRTLKKEDSK